MPPSPAERKPEPGLSAIEPTGAAVYRAINAVSAAIAKVGVAKTRTNVQQGYKFRGIDDVMNALAPSLAEHNLVILPNVLQRDVTERTNKSGGVLFSVIVKVRFDFVSAVDGSSHPVFTYGEAMDSGDKATNKAMSAAYKYAAFQTFCIPVEAMAADADTETHEVIAQAPAGYDEFLADYESVADEGLVKLRAAFKAAKPEFREWLMSADKAKQDAIVERAKRAASKPMVEA